MAESNASPAGVPAPRGFGYRWTIVALLFGATTVNYIDRQVLSILAPTLTRQFGWTEADYGHIVSWWSVAYGFGLLFAGRFMDRDLLVQEDIYDPHRGAYAKNLS